MRTAFHTQLEQLTDQIVRMGQLVAHMIESATLSLARKDSDLARQVIAADEEINRLQIEIEMVALQLFALQQPMARDLRRIGCGLKLVTDLERMADHAKAIAKITIQLEGEPLIKPLIDLPRMAVMAQEMTRAAMDAYVAEDPDAARAMIAQDHEIDHVYRSVFDELLGLMEENPGFVRQGTLLLHTAQYLERIGDHATNLGEWTIFLVTGELQELND